ncbi:Retrovirus-related Pol polyprotein from type-1 retrotransposable element R2, partial [Pseudolycoriella hygida]
KKRNQNQMKEIMDEYKAYMSTTGVQGTYIELCCAANIFGFIGMVIEEDEHNKCYNCFEIGLTSNQDEDKSKPKIFIIFTGNQDSDHFELLDSVKPKSPSLFKCGKYLPVPNNNNKLFIRLTDDKDGNEQSQNSKLDRMCEICKKYCNGTKGLAIHISKKHKTDQRKKVVKKYETSSETNKAEEETYSESLHSDENNRTYAKVSNPERESKRDRQKRKQKHHRDWIQWLYYNQRKKAVRLIANDTDNVCTIELSTIYEKFNERWRTENKEVIIQDPISSDIQKTLDDNFDFNIPVEDLEFAIKSISSDSAPGPDFIIPRTMKKHSASLSKVLSKLLSIILKWNYIPTILREARTTLLFKKGDRRDVKNWRPLTICSIVRRILEKVIDKLLRSYLVASCTQRGFTSEPGTLINTSILQAALNKAKIDKSTLYVTLLDVTQAYDNVGHDQLKMSLNAQPIPTLLRYLTITLDDDNYTQIKTIKGKTKKIFFKRGIMQDRFELGEISRSKIRYETQLLTSKLLVRTTDLRRRARSRLQSYIALHKTFLTLSKDRSSVDTAEYFEDEDTYPNGYDDDDEVSDESRDESNRNNLKSVTGASSNMKNLLFLVKS